MQITTNSNSSFPDQIVSDQVKATLDYGLQVARAIEGEWFRNYRGGGYRFATNFNNYHRLRLYARAEQPVQKYKDELSLLLEGENHAIMDPGFRNIGAVAKQIMEIV